MTDRVRALFISDVHLGTRACQAERLLGFLRRYESEFLFLVGDIIDFWAMNRDIVWSEPQNTVVQKVLRRARHGEKDVFIPGNHDEALREYVDTSFGGIEVVAHYVRTAADRRRYLLIHGDKFDQVTRYHRWVAKLGDAGYAALVRANGWLSTVRRSMRRPGYWSLAGYAKHKVKTAIDFIFDFEESVVRYAKQQGYDGVICGHVHCAAQKTIDGVAYLNCGDWVDSCTAIVEHFDGRMKIVYWGREQQAQSVITLARPVRTAQSAASGREAARAAR